MGMQSYLPGRTPAGLVKLREEDLENLRGKRADGSTTSEIQMFQEY